jgi:2-amino-4-hydroxy-6-hydroxymethyldihydropteridine diphosphokinase
MVEAYVALGSNVEGPAHHVQQAILEIGSFTHTKVVAQSSLYRTPPWGKLDQPDFINAVVKIQTRHTALELFLLLQDVENKHARQRVEKWGPRTLDCDLILYGQEIIDTPDLIVPHPRMKTRGFVLLPLAEIVPTCVLPSGEAILDLVSRCDCTGIEKLC